MRITELIRPGQPCGLCHPDLGNVLWTDRPVGMPGGFFRLVFAQGRERGWSLVADAEVLLDDRWEAAPLAEAEETEPAPLDLDKLVPNPTALSSAMDVAGFAEELRGNPLDNPALWKRSAGQYLHELKNALLTLHDLGPNDDVGMDHKNPNWPLFAWVLAWAGRKTASDPYVRNLTNRST